MTQSSTDCFEREQHQQRSDLTAASPESTEATSKIETCTTSPPLHQVTPAEYIYSTMIPPSKPSPSDTEIETTSRPVTLGKRGRCNTGGSSVPPGPILSMDLFLSPEDLQVDINDVNDLGGMLGLNSDDIGLKRLQSSDIVQGMLLPDVATTAAVALKGSAAQPPPPLPQCNANANATPSRQQQRADRGNDQLCPIANLTAYVGRMSTGDDIAPLNENFDRISSTDWVKDFPQADPEPMHPSLFVGNNALRNPSPALLSKSAPANSYFGYSDDQILPEVGSSSDWERVAQQFSTALPADNPPPANPSYRHYPPPLPPLSNSNIMQNTPVTSPVASAPDGNNINNNNVSPSSSTTSKQTKKKKKKKRTIDESRAVEPTDDDVLFGRGGFTNTHPGNIRFRAKALELRPWYEQSTTSKEEKYQISDMLVESVRGFGHRFLERGEDGLWHEVIGNGARKKASQALRERVRGKRSARGSGKLSSSGTKPKDDAKDSIADVDVVGV